MEVAIDSSLYDNIKDIKIVSAEITAEKVYLLLETGGFIIYERV